MIRPAGARVSHLMHPRFETLLVPAAALSILLPGCFSPGETTGLDTETTGEVESTGGVTPMTTPAGGADTGEPGDADGETADGTGGTIDGSSTDGGDAGGASTAEDSGSTGGDDVDTDTGDGDSGTDSGATTGADQSRVVFVWTGNSVTSPMSFGGVAGADALCQARADEVGLDGTFMAWLGDPAARFSHAGGPFMRIDGEVVAEDWADLTDGDLLAPISHTAEGESLEEILIPTTDVVTDTNPDASNKLIIAPCAGFTGAGFSPGLGSALATDVTWTELGAGNEAACDQTWVNLYCFEQ